MLRMKLEKKGYKVIENKMLSTLNTFGEPIYIDVCLIEESRHYRIVGDYEYDEYRIIGANEPKKLREYAKLDKTVFTKAMAMAIFTKIKEVQK